MLVVAIFRGRSGRLRDGLNATTLCGQAVLGARRSHAELEVSRSAFCSSATAIGAAMRRQHPARFLSMLRRYVALLPQQLSSMSAPTCRIENCFAVANEVLTMGRERPAPQGGSGRPAHRGTGRSRPIVGWCGGREGRRTAPPVYAHRDTRAATAPVAISSCGNDLPPTTSQPSCLRRANRLASRGTTSSPEVVPPLSSPRPLSRGRPGG